MIFFLALYLVALCTMIYLKHCITCFESERSVRLYYLRKLNKAYVHEADVDFWEAMRAEEFFFTSRSKA